MFPDLMILDNYDKAGNEVVDDENEDDDENGEY